MSRTGAALAAFFVVAAVVVGLLLWQQNRGWNPQSLAPAPQEATPAPTPAEPQMHYPIETPEASAESLPELDASDEAFQRTLGELLGRTNFKNLFQPQNIVRRIVVTVDNLPREVVSERLRPVKPVPGAFAVERDGTAMRLDAANFARYTPYVRALERVDTDTLTKVYSRFYPLFQSAYRELGYPKGYFNDRLVQVLDHLIAAPPLEEMPALVQPHVVYRYADPSLESASAGHKLMWRMGNENAARVKTKLREIRSALAANATTSPQPS